MALNLAKKWEALKNLPRFFSGLFENRGTVFRISPRVKHLLLDPLGRSSPNYAGIDHPFAGTDPVLQIPWVDEELMALKSSPTVGWFKEHGFYMLMFGSQPLLTMEHWWMRYTAWWWLGTMEFWMTWMTFDEQLGILFRSQLTKSIIFQRGRYTTNQSLISLVSKCSLSIPLDPIYSLLIEFPHVYWVQFNNFTESIQFQISIIYNHIYNYMYVYIYIYMCIIYIYIYINDIIYICTYIYIYCVCMYIYIVIYIYHVYISSCFCVYFWLGNLPKACYIFEKPLRQVEVTCPPCVAAAVGSSPSWEVIKCPKKEKHKAEMPQTWGMFVRSVDTFLDTWWLGWFGTIFSTRSPTCFHLFHLTISLNQHKSPWSSTQRAGTGSR